MAKIELIALITNFSYSNIDLNKRETQITGLNILHIAAGDGDMRVIKLLLDHSEIVDFNLTDDENRTALHLACKYKQSEVVKKLLTLKGVIAPSLTMLDDKNRTPLDIEMENVSQGYPSNVQELIRKFSP